MGSHSQHGKQLNRKEKYFEIFNNIDHKPTTRELATMMGVSANQVSRDIRELNLTDLWQSINIITPAMNREALYKKYFFDAEVKMSTRELAKLVGVSHNSVARDLRELEEKYGYGTLDNRTRGEINFQGRIPLYEKYISDSHCDIPLHIIAKELNIPISKIRADFRKLGVSFISFNEFEHTKFIKSVESHISLYKEHYFHTYFPKSHKEIAEMLRMTLGRVRYELKFLKENSEEYGIDLSYTLDNKIEKRKQEYVDLFNKLGYIPFCHNTAKFLSFNRNLVSADYRRFGFKANEKKIVPNEVKYGAALKRLPFYRIYQNSGNLWTQNELADRFGISVTNISKDLKVLREVFGIQIETVNDKRIKYPERFSLYTDYFKNHTFESTKKLSEDLNLNHNTVISDFDRYDLYTFFNLDKPVFITHVPYSMEEEEIIRKYYPTEGYLIVNRLPNRTKQGICYKARSLGVKKIKEEKPKKSENGKIRKVRWSSSEIEILMEYYPIEGSRVVERLNNRSEATVRMRASQLKIHKNKPLI